LAEVAHAAHPDLKGGLLETGQSLGLAPQEALAFASRARALTTG